METLKISSRHTYYTDKKKHSNILKTYSFQFWLLCLSGLLFFASFSMMIPDLPAHLSAMGGKEYVGLIISLFTLTALISRPFSGKLADQWGRIPVMIFGATVSAVAALFYPLAATVFPFLLVRLFHGFSTGFKPTGTAAYVADIVPANRRGEAMGILGFCSNLGSAMGPSIGPFIVKSGGIDAMFYTSSVLAVLSVAILFRIKETLKERRPLSLDMFKIRRNDIIEPKVIMPSIVLLLTVFSMGAILTIGPFLSDALGVPNRGYYFTTYVVASLLVRFAAGRASDKYGRVPVLLVSVPILIAANVCLGLATSMSVFFAGSILMGFAMGMTSPTIYAWTIDLSPKMNIGRGVATMYIALEAGIGSGAIISGYLYNTLNSTFTIPFLSCSLLGLLALVILLFQQKPKPIESLQNS